MNDRYKPGSRPPYINLREALRLAAQIYEQGGGQASKDLMSKITGNTSSSSSFTRKVNALKAFGLAAEDKGQIFLTHTGAAAVAPTNPEDAAEARKMSFQRIDVFKRVYERHKGKILPADEFLRNILQQDCGIERDLLGDWLSSLKDSLDAAGLLHDRGDGRMQIRESPIIRHPRLTEEKANQSAASASALANESISSEVTTGPPSTQFSSGGHNTKIELSGKRFAFFSIPDALTARDANKLKSAISGLTAIIDSMVREEGN